MSERWRYFWPGYLWALPNVLVALALMATWHRPQSMAWRDGCLEIIVKGHILGGPQILAQTLGWIIFIRDEEAARRSDLQVHERVHVVQYLLLGPLFLPLYGLEYAWLRWGRGLSDVDAYLQLWSERQAYRVQDEHVMGLRDLAWGSR